MHTLAEVLHASGDFDEAGEAYWGTELNEMQNHIARAMNRLSTSRETLRQNMLDSMKFEENHFKSPKLKKALELGLGAHEYEPEAFLARDLAWSSRILTHLDALLVNDSEIRASAAEPDLKRLYALVSNAGRQLAEDTAKAMQSVIHDSRITHESSNIVETVWASEGTPDDKTKHLSEEKA